MLQIAQESLEDQLIANQRQIDALLLEQSRLAARFAESQAWSGDGFISAIHWMRFNCHLTSAMAANYVCVGEEASRMARTVAEVEQGELGYSHLLVMARTAKFTGKAFDEDRLLPLARESSPGKFHYQCLHYRHSVSARDYNQGQERLREERSLSLSTAEDGCLVVSGLLDTLSGAEVRNALEPLARPSGAHDDRTREQRLADAFYEKVTGNQRAELQVTASLETLKAHAGAAAGEMEFSLPLSSAAVQRIACDCSLTRVLLSQESLTIDVGRSKRVVDGALRKALRLRDQHCQWPGCERPASYCDGHHIVHWIHGGETNLANVVLLCRRHHRMVHEGGWQLVKTDAGKIISIAPTITFGMPRGPD